MGILGQKPYERVASELLQDTSQCSTSKKEETYDVV